MEKVAILDEHGAGRNANGLSIITTTVFLAGELAGTGVMALPYSMEGTGYVGLLFILLSCLSSCYTGHLLGRSWTIIQSRYEEFKGHVRHPYPVLAFITYGRVGRAVMSWTINFSMSGSLVIFLVLSSQNIRRLLQDVLHLEVPFCLLMIAVAACIAPMTWLGTPKDFWPVALGAAFSTALAVALCLVAIVWDTSLRDYSTVKHSTKDPLTFFESLGTICFSTGGHYAFLTFQNDMKQPDKFHRSLLISYTVLALLYLPIATLGYVAYGLKLAPNILLTLDASPLTYVILLLVTCHQIFAFVITMNPMVQHLEEVIHLDKAFSLRRVLLRTAVVLLVLFVAETVPKFGFIVSLLGGSALMLTNTVAPPILYQRLCRLPGDWPTVEVPLRSQILCVVIVISGIVIGSASTYGSFKSLWGSAATFTVPCYVNMTAAAGGQ